MRSEHQVRAELDHHKRLLRKLRKEDLIPMNLETQYQTRVHLLSWVLEDSTTF